MCARRCSGPACGRTRTRTVTAAGAARRLHVRPEILAGGGEVEAEYAKDTWEAPRLGIAVRRGRDKARFGAIGQEWLREAIKQWSRFRLSSGYSFNTIDSGAQSLARFSLFLAEHPEVTGFDGITRELLEEFLSWMSARACWSVNTRHHTLTFVKVLLDWGHRHGTLPGLAANAVIYEEEVSRPADHLPQFIPEFVMNQLESDANLARLRNPTVRHLVVLLMETGLRGGDACALPFNPIFEDSVGWPCLRFDDAKVKTEQLIPLSEKAAAAIRDQQAHVRMVLARRLAVAVPRHPTRTPTAPCPTRTARCRVSSATGRRTSTCATKPARPCASTPTSSATPSGPG